MMADPRAQAVGVDRDQLLRDLELDHIEHLLYPGDPPRSNRVFMFFGFWATLLLGLAIGHAYADATRLGDMQIKFLDGYQEGLQAADSEWQVAGAEREARLKKLGLCSYAVTACKRVKP